VEEEPGVVVRTGNLHRVSGGRTAHDATPVDCTELTVYPRASRRPGLVTRLLERVAF
jgi:hypothetical protein